MSHMVSCIVIHLRTKMLENLKILNLSHSHDLTETPDFSYLPNLEKLPYILIHVSQCALDIGSVACVDPVDNNAARGPYVICKKVPRWIDHMLPQDFTPLPRTAIPPHTTLMRESLLGC
ncbi:hypothetical protein MTR_4g021043 [Medicago truncatula]|uniref:Uncharacterized protein n=1 Tax=Medicago truncatula TaxID=3880 RepID=A0A072UT16_MEDTR|nr:hypothetical protein MTR_4g021043 [Medicago truncatula]